MQKPIRLLVFEDNDDMRDGLTWILRNNPAFQLLGAYPHAKDVVQILSQHSPDVVLMDLQMPGLSGLDALKVIKTLKPDVQVVILTTFDDDDNIFNAIRNGATGYLLKSNVTDELARSILDVMEGGSPMHARVARKVLNYLNIPAPPKPDYQLTPRENEVLAILVEGNSVKMVAQILGISDQTVGNHIRHIYEKLQVHSRGEAVAKVFRDRIG